MARESVNVTPGRVRAQAAREKTYVPFNPRPDQVGTLTGKAMPSNVPRTSDGFEDPEAFFRSPNTTADSRSISMALNRTPGGGAGSIAASSPTNTLYGTPGGQSSAGRTRASRAGARSDAGSVGFRTPVASGRNNRKRLSDLEGNDDDDEAAVGADLLVDDEFDGPSHFSPSNAPALSLPRSSRLPPASPSVAYDSLPSPSTASPSKRRRTAAKKTSASPQRRGNLSYSTSSALANVTREEVDVSVTYDEGVPGGDVSMDIEGDVTAEAELSPDEDAVDEGTTFRTESRRSEGRSSKSLRNNGGDEDEEEEGVEEDSLANLSRSVRGKKSMSSRRTTTGTTATDDDADASHRYEPDTGNDYDMNDRGDYDAGDNGYPDGADEEGSVDLERRAVEAEGGDEDVDEDEDPAPRERTKVKTVRGKVGRPKVQKIPRERRPAADAARAQARTRMSGIGAFTEDGYSGDFTTRRSARRHIQPLAYWRGEKVTYRNGDYLAELDEIVRVPVDPAPPLAAKYRKANAKARARSRSAAPRATEEEEDDNAANDAETNPVGVVKEFATDKEISRRVALPTSRLDPKEVAGSGFRYQKVFGEDQFIAAGVVYIPVGGSKPGKHSKDNSYVFFVQQGTVKVDIHRTSFILCKGGQFMVPRGNQYSITNMSEKLEAQLFFAQARKLRMTEEEDLALRRINAASQSGDGASQRSRTSSAAPSKKAGTKSNKSARRDDSEDDEERTPRQKAKTGKRVAA